eukprot:6511447-Alexandrium_andersonii.AAC.1
MVLPGAVVDIAWLGAPVTWAPLVVEQGGGVVGTRRVAADELHDAARQVGGEVGLSLIHISEPTRLALI